MGQARDVVVGKFAALNAKDEDKMVGYFSPQAEKQIPGGTLSGSDQIAAFVSAFWAAFPDIELALVEVVEQGSKVSVRGAMVGTHAGTLHTPAGDIPATGQRIDLAFSDSYEVVRRPHRGLASLLRPAELARATRSDGSAGRRLRWS
jgi:predicted ester cyclase